MSGRRSPRLLLEPELTRGAPYCGRRQRRVGFDLPVPAAARAFPRSPVKVCSNAWCASLAFAITASRGVLPAGGPLMMESRYFGDAPDGYFDRLDENGATCGRANSSPSPIGVLEMTDPPTSKHRRLSWIWHNLDTLLALLIAVALAVYSTFWTVEIDRMIAAILATLGLLAFGILRDRSERQRLVEAVNLLQALPNAPSLDISLWSLKDERDLLAVARSDVLIVQETGNLLFEQNRPALVGLLRGQVRVRVALASPAAAPLLAQRNRSMNAADLRLRSQSGAVQLREIAKEAGQHAELLEVRYLTAPPSVTGASVALDSTGHKHAIIARQAGYRIDFTQKICLNAESDSDPRTVEYHRTQFERLFEFGSKFMLVSGPPRVGKTTLLKSLAEAMGHSPRVFAVISTEMVGNDGKRNGFAVTSGSGAPVRFAERVADTYTVIPAVWELVVSQMRAAADAGHIIVLDEIGPLQIKVPGFLQLINDLLGRPNQTVVASIAQGEANEIEQLKRHWRTTTIALTPDNRDETLSDLRCQLESTLDDELI